jgi:inhibitor of KinA sporulation pathway (predicted exonuclease)
VVGFVLFRLFSLIVCLLQRLVNDTLRDRWLELDDEKDKKAWRVWGTWDKKRYARDYAIYEKARESEMAPPADDKDEMKAVHVPKKKRSAASTAEPGSPFNPIPKKGKQQ